MHALGLSWPPITRMREVRQISTNRTGVSFCASVGARSARTANKNHSKNTELGALKWVSARWIRARPSLHIYLRQATTPTSRRWKYVHAAREFRRVRKNEGLAHKHMLVARSARRQQVSPSKVL